MPATLQSQLAMPDPRERLAATLAILDTTIEHAANRVRHYRDAVIRDPDGATIAKCIELSARLQADYWATARASVESIATLDRAAAIAELEAVLAVWKDPSVSDEQWRASRQPAQPTADGLAPRPGTVRRRKRTG